MKYNLLGVAEAARFLGVSKQRVMQLIAQHPDFPEPVAELHCGRIWAREDVESWARKHGRALPGRVEP